MVQVCIWPRTLSPSKMTPPPYWSESCRKEIAPSFLMKTWPHAEAEVAHEPFRSTAFAGVTTAIKLAASVEVRANVLNFMQFLLMCRRWRPDRLQEPAAD